MSHSAALEMNGLGCIGNLPSKGILELFLSCHVTLLFIHKTPTNCDRNHSRWHCEMDVARIWPWSGSPSIRWCRLTWWEGALPFTSCAVHLVLSSLGTSLICGHQLQALSLCWGNSIKRIWMMFLLLLLLVCLWFLPSYDKCQASHFWQ